MPSSLSRPTARGRVPAKLSFCSSGYTSTLTRRVAQSMATAPSPSQRHECNLPGVAGDPIAKTLISDYNYANHLRTTSEPVAITIQK